MAKNIGTMVSLLPGRLVIEILILVILISSSLGSPLNNDNTDDSYQYDTSIQEEGIHLTQTSPSYEIRTNRKSRQQNYPFIIYGGCSPYGLHGGYNPNRQSTDKSDEVVFLPGTGQAGLGL
ncbi:uncharacterized protein LOC118438189 [Folsomia candida]|uniref:uncharacterized protein LOC118438189 n=1 Tax=Folsomia candida TaxID=158441 RepID=UPI0016054A11|nr:uncharacterized protein LOC118438189 [Folsomia candida]